VSSATSASRDDVVMALRTVLDPELHRSIVDLGMVGDVAVDDGRVTISIKLTVAGCPLKAEIQRRVGEAVTALPGVDGVHVTLDTMSDDERRELRFGITGTETRESPFAHGARTNVILVASGKGGVGKSSITANLACALAARGHSVGLLDADVYGYSIPRMMGVSRAPVMLGDDLILPVEAHGVRLMSVGFMASDDQPVIWRGPMLHKALTSFVTEVFWDDPDYLLVDLPPGTGDVSLSLASLAPAAAGDRDDPTARCATRRSARGRDGAAGRPRGARRGRKHELVRRPRHRDALRDLLRRWRCDAGGRTARAAPRSGAARVRRRAGGCAGFLGAPADPPPEGAAAGRGWQRGGNTRTNNGRKSSGARHL